MDNILITAFEPFNGKEQNSSFEVLNRLNRSFLIKEILPVSYEKSKKIMKELIDKYHPKLIINLGEASGEKKLRFEKYAHNYQRSSIEDNDGVVINKGIVVKDGPICLETVLDIEGLVDNLNEHNIPAYISLSAGSYICNTTYYTSLYENKNRAIFIHLPNYIGQFENAYGLELNDMVDYLAYFVDKVHSRMIRR